MDHTSAPPPTPLVYDVPALQRALGGDTPWSWQRVNRLIKDGAFGDPATLPRRGRHRLIPAQRVQAWLDSKTQREAS